MLRSDAPFYWPLRGSIALQNGSGTPAFARATAKWMFNDEGKLIKLPSGAIEMRGYRPVINLLSNTENLAAWSNTDMGPSAVSDPDGGTKAYLITAASTSAFIQGASYPVDGAVTIYHKVIIKPDAFAWWRFRLSDSTGTNYVSKWINVATQTVGSAATNGTGWSFVDFTITAHAVSGWYVIRFIAKFPSSATSPRTRIDPVDGNNSNAKTTTSGAKLTLYKPQSTNITWMSDPTAANDEYVSAGVLAAPYHGAGVDGVKYFATTKSGASIPESSLIGAWLNPNSTTNNLLYCRDLTNAIWSGSATGSELVVNGAPGADTSGWYANDSTLSIVSGALQITTITDYGRALQALSLTVGKRYIVSFTFTKTGGNAEVGISYNSTGSSGMYDGKINVSASGTYSFGFIAGSSTRYLSLQINTATPGDTGRFSLISVKEAGIQASLTQTGLDGQANASSLLTATADNATISQTITAASAAGCSGYYVRRVTGTGNVYFTRDGGTNWTDITSLINGSTLTQIKIENTSVLNPQVGFKIATSGDQIHVDAGLDHLGTELANPILTTSAAVTVNADVPTAPISGNFSDTAGTILATVTRDTWATGNGSAVGSATRGLYTSAANSGAQGLDGTNTANGPSGTPSGTMRIGIRWSGSSLQAFSEGAFGSVGSYDGSFNLASIAAMAGVRGGIKDIAIWPSSLSDADMISASKGMTLDGSVASLVLSAQNSLMTIGRTIEADAAQLNLSTQNAELIIGRTIEAGAASLLLGAQNSLMTIGRTVEADAAAITVIAPDGRVLLDDSPRSAVTIAATLASPTIKARL